ncbi:MAG: hypothetical protein JWM80_1397 [Cyanobacteria bacterium RYN_339]|nr:hypothetical protein [Cyanobacteria bacterium RYN_339]
MAHLPIRKKPQPADAIHLMPMALVLVVGVGVTLAFEGGRRPPQEVAHALKQEVVQEVVPLAQLQLDRLADVGTQAREAKAAKLTFEVQGRNWVVAPHAPITDFKPEELQFREEIDGWTLVANKLRGLTDLNPHAHAYDRLYVDLGHARYAPLRWRDVPAK